METDRRSGSNPDLGDLTHSRVGCPRLIGSGSSPARANNIDWIRSLPTGRLSKFLGLAPPTSAKTNGSLSNWVGSSKITGSRGFKSNSASHSTDPDRQNLTGVDLVSCLNLTEFPKLTKSRSLNGAGLIWLLHQ